MAEARESAADAPLDGCTVSPAVHATARALLPLLYPEVRRIASLVRRRAGAGETLRTTALVHEAFIKLRPDARFVDQQHFLRAAALAMRHLLVNRAREAMAAKHGAGAVHLPLEDAEAAVHVQSSSLLEVHEALVRLAARSSRLAEVVECRFFGGLDAAATARALGITERTVGRDWVKARAWLRKELDAAEQ